MAKSIDQLIILSLEEHPADYETDALKIMKELFCQNIENIIKHL